MTIGPHLICKSQVTGGGEGTWRSHHHLDIGHSITGPLQERAAALLSLSRAFSKDAAASQWNFEACAVPVTKAELINYIRHDKRIDMEQAVAMVIGYLSSLPQEQSTADVTEDDFENRDVSVVEDLVNDPSTVEMLRDAYMWRMRSDCELSVDPQTASVMRKKDSILETLGQRTTISKQSDSEFLAIVQAARRKRAALKDSQHLAIPENLLPADASQTEKREWSSRWDFNSSEQADMSIECPNIISKRRFRKAQRLLTRLRPLQDSRSRYCYDVQCLSKEYGAISPQRIAVLQASEDPAAIAYSFITAQRDRQRKVVSDHRWSHFLVKGEAAMILQNRPDVLTSFEDILVRRAVDLKALTAVRCPKGVRDHFSSTQDIVDKTRKVCEMMERYVRLFGNGKMQNLVYGNEENMRFLGVWFKTQSRGPVDFYNRLCDELRDCRSRAEAVGMDLGITPVHKFLAIDIMASNDAWLDDAFAAGKVPGWVEYLAMARMGELNIDREGTSNDFVLC